MTSNIVLGAEIAGLATAYGARKLHRPATIFEARERAGGLLDGFSIGDFHFDTGAHVSFATEPEVREVFDQTEFYEHDPRGLCWDRHWWLKHPVQTNTTSLPTETKVSLIAGCSNRRVYLS